MKFILIALIASVSAIKVEGVDSYLTHPIPVVPAVAEKPHHYNRVCDEKSPSIEACKAGNP